MNVVRRGDASIVAVAGQPLHCTVSIDLVFGFSDSNNLPFIETPAIPPTLPVVAL